MLKASIALVKGRLFMTNILYSSGTTVVKSSLAHVKEIIGNPGCKSLFEKILKKDDIKNTSIVRYQINIGSRSTESNPKPVSSLINAKSWGKKYPKGTNDGICWVTVESSIEKFVRFVELGFPYRLGIKEGGNSLKHYKGNFGLGFDLDNNSGVTLEQTIKRLRELELQGIIHYSPSGNPENNKFRLILFFNEFVEDYSKVNHLTKCLGSLLPNNSNNVHDPGRFFYGTIRAIPHVDYQTNDFKFLYAKYSQILEYIEEKSVPSVIDFDETNLEGLTIPQRFGIKFSQWLEKSNQCLGSFITKICEHFDLSLDNWHLHDSPGENIEQWRGLDPIHPEQSTTGSSFTVYHSSNGTYGYKSDRVGAYGDLIDLWLRLKHHAWDVNGGVNSRHKQDYWLAFREICDFLEVDWIKEFEKEKEEKQTPTEQSREITPSESITETSKLERKENTEIKTISVEEAKSQVQTILEDELVLTWKDCYLYKKDGSVSLCPTHCGLYFLQNYKDCFYYDTIQDCFWLKENHIWRRYLEREFRAEVLSFIIKQPNLGGIHNLRLLTDTFKSKLNKWFEHLTKEYLIRNLEPSWNHIPCKNGVFDVETKKLIPYSENTAFITHQLPYTRKKATGIGIRALRTFLELLFKDNRSIDDVLLWMSGVVQNQGYKMKQALSLVGDSGAGKSTLCDLLSNLIAPKVKDTKYEIPIIKDLDASKTFNDDGLFNLQSLEYQRLVIISEFTGFSKNSSNGANILKKLIGGDPQGYDVVTPIKHVNGDRIFPFKGAFITNSQNYTKFKSEDVGINRRFMIINVQGISGDRPDIFNPLRSFEILEDLWNYFLDFDLVEDVYPRMEELARADCRVEWKIDSTTLMNQANNRYWTFAEECLDIITPESLGENAPIPQASAKQVYETYVKWCQSQGERFPGTQTAFGLGITKAISHFTKVKNDDIKKRTARGVIYQFIQIKTDLG